MQLFTAIDFGSNIGMSCVSPFFSFSCVLLVVCNAWLMIDFNTVDALVEISQKYREIFY